MATQTSINNLSNVLSSSGNVQGNLKTSTITKSNTFSRIQIANSTVNLMDMPEIRETKSIAGDILLWGNSVFGIWNSFKWGNSSSTSFVLGNSLAGVLGISKLGSQSSSYQVREIINPNRIFRWLLSSAENTYWVDTGNTTATVTASTSIAFTTGQILQTNKLSTEYYNLSDAIFIINGSNITNSSNLTYYLSADNGSNFEAVTLNTLHTFTNVGKNLIIKIVASGNATISLKNSVGIRSPIAIDYEVTT